MAELAMLADLQRTVYPEEVTRQLHVMAQDRESSPLIDRRSNQPLCYATNMQCVTISKRTDLQCIENISIFTYLFYLTELILGSPQSSTLTLSGFRKKSGWISSMLMTHKPWQLLQLTMKTGSEAVDVITVFYGLDLDIKKLYPRTSNHVTSRFYEVRRQTTPYYRYK